MKNKNPDIIIKQCKKCGKVFGYVAKNKEDNFEYCLCCEKEQNFNNFINSFNLFKKENEKCKK